MSLEFPQKREEVFGSRYHLATATNETGLLKLVLAASKDIRLENPWLLQSAVFLVTEQEAAYS